MIINRFESNPKVYDYQTISDSKDDSDVYSDEAAEAHQLEGEKHKKNCRNATTVQKYAQCRFILAITKSFTFNFIYRAEDLLSWNISVLSWSLNSVVLISTCIVRHQLKADEKIRHCDSHFHHSTGASSK